MSPTSRTLKFLREMGYHADVVERWVKPVRKDLFGFGDLFAFSPDDPDVYIIQVTSTGNMKARLRKIQQSEIAQAWVKKEHCTLLIIGWRKYAKSKEGKFWRPTFYVVGESDYV